MRTRILLAGIATASITALAACGGGSDHAAHSSMSGMSHSASPDGMGDMPMMSGAGLDPTTDGYTFTPKAMPMAGMAMPATFTITKNGKPVTAFTPEQTKLMHFYLIRSDLTGFQHLHPTMQPDGVWTVKPGELTAGKYRMYVQFIPRAAQSAGVLVLSRSFEVAGKAARPAVVSPPGDKVSVDGYTLTLAGMPKAGNESPLTITVEKNGRPVTDLQPYLDTYAHVTAFRKGNLAFAHLHPTGKVNGARGGPELTLHADLPQPGRYRMFVQFQTAGQLHTAAFTISAT
jgi:hypothetical protein